MINRKAFIKDIAMLSLVLVSFAFAHDYEFKDKYGRTTGYVDKGKNGTIIIKDKYGRTEKYIHNDGTITDNFGRTKGKISKK